MNRNGCPVKMALPALQQFPEETVVWNMNSSDFNNSCGIMGFPLQKGSSEWAFSVEAFVCSAW